jgi:hypothetical protein
MDFIVDFRWRVLLAIESYRMELSILAILAQHCTLCKVSWISFYNCAARWVEVGQYWLTSEQLFQPMKGLVTSTGPKPLPILSQEIR